MKLSHRMKILILMLLTAASVRAQTGDSALQQIRQVYQEVNQHIASYRMKDVYMEGISTEGATLQGYYAGDTLRLMVQDVMGEMYKYRLEVYYEADTPVFYYERWYLYEVPLFDPAFDVHKSKVSETRGYFTGGKMIRWIDEKNSIFQQRNTAFIKTEQTFLKTAVDLRQVLKAGYFDPPANK